MATSKDNKEISQISNGVEAFVADKEKNSWRGEEEVVTCRSERQGTVESEPRSGDSRRADYERAMSILIERAEKGELTEEEEKRMKAIQKRNAHVDECIAEYSRRRDNSSKNMDDVAMKVKTISHDMEELKEGVRRYKEEVAKYRVKVKRNSANVDRLKRQVKRTFAKMDDFCEAVDEYEKLVVEEERDLAGRPRIDSLSSKKQRIH